MVTLDPIAIPTTPLAAVYVKLDGQLMGGGIPMQALIVNESIYACQVYAGGVQKWLPAWTADVIDVRGDTQLRIVPVLITSAQSNVPSAQLLVTIAVQGESFPGVFPLALNRLTSISAGTVLITGTPTVNIGNTPTVNVSGTVTVAITGTPAVTISGTPSVAITSGTVTVTSGTVNVQNVPSTNLNTASPQASLGTISVPQGTTQSTSYVVPPGTHTLGVQLSDVSSDWLTLSVIGFDTGQVYYDQIPAADNQLTYWFPLPTVLESKWTVTVQTGALVGAQTARVFAVLDTTAVVLAPYGQAPLPITLEQMLPANLLHQAKAAVFNVGLGASATLDLVAAIAGESIYALAWSFVVATAGTTLVSLENGSSTTVDFIDTRVTGHVTRPLHGVSFGSNIKARLRNTTGTAAGIIAGALIYAQY